MKKRHILLALLLCCAVGTLLLQASAEEEKKKKKREEYDATAIVSGGAGGMVRLSIFIDSYTPDEEVLRLAGILKSEGPDALAKAIDKTERGRIAATGRIGNDVNVARTFQTEKGRVIRLLSNRPLGFLELRHGGRSTDYQFSVVEIILNQKGEGQGVAIGAAKIWFNKENQLEVEQLGTYTTRITNVRPF